ncbi:DMT family transporter [Magnetovibrio sp. PR-2]|uniref:DMT family transporter n=1 Tax=Magnetovibrio sp. PR-2 TaxID=3120356 RepID=UPI002FCDF70C
MTELERRAQSWTLFATVLVSTSFPVVGMIAHGLDSSVMAFLRFSLAAVLFGPLVAWRVGLPLPSLKDLARYGTVSAFMVGFFWAMFEALRYTSPLNTATIFTLTPLIAAVVSAFLLKERLKKRSMAALGLGLVGAIWVIYRGNFSDLLGMAWNKGDTIFLLGTCSMALYGPLVKFLHRGEPMARMSFWVLTTGAFWMLLISFPNLQATAWGEVPMNIYLGIGYLAVFTTVITFFIFHWSSTIVGPTKVLSYTYLNPALVLVIGLILGDAAPPMLTFPGLALVVGAMVVLQLTAHKSA